MLIVNQFYKCVTKDQREKETLHGLPDSHVRARSHTQGCWTPCSTAVPPMFKTTIITLNPPEPQFLLPLKGISTSNTQGEMRQQTCSAILSVYKCVVVANNCSLFHQMWLTCAVEPGEIIWAQHLQKRVTCFLLLQARALGSDKPGWDYQLWNPLTVNLPL